MTSTNKRDSKLFPLVDPLQYHEYMVFPDKTGLELTSEEITFSLELLYRSHSTLVGMLRSASYSQTEKDKAYDMALKAEKLYAKIMMQLSGKNDHPSVV